MYFHTHFHDYGKILIHFDVQMYFFFQKGETVKKMREEVSLNIEKISKNIYYPPAHCTPPQQVTKDHNEIPGEVNFVMHDSNLLRICLNN